MDQKPSSNLPSNSRLSAGRPAFGRRTFLRTAGAAASAPLILRGGLLGQDAPSKKLTAALVGCGGQGMGLLGGFLGRDDVQVVAVCDVHDAHDAHGRGNGNLTMGREPAKARVEKHYADRNEEGYKGCDATLDFREVCGRDDIDIVVVATPDHWHALVCLDAVRNGKDVYCEKPVTHLFTEGRVLADEVAARGAILQVGSQQRSDVRFRLAVEAVRNGLLGKVRRVEVGLPRGRNNADGNAGLTEVPEGLDYDFWTGPSELLPFNGARNHWSWRWHTAYGGGQLMDWIQHHNDINHWALDMDGSGPEMVEAVDWTMYDNEDGLYDTPIDYEVKCQYPGGIEVSIGSRNRMGVTWYGEGDNQVYVTRGEVSATDRAWITESEDRGEWKGYVSNNHTGNFIDCVKSREAPIVPAEAGHRAASPGYLGWASFLLGRPLKWDAVKEEVVGDEEADKFLKAVNYRGDWKLKA